MGTIYSEFQKSLKRGPGQPAIQFIKKSQVQTWDYQTLDEKVTQFARGLKSLGFKKGDAVAMISLNHPDWAIVDLALSREGMILVPMHTTLSHPQLLTILKKAEVTGLVLGKGVEDRVSPLLKELPPAIGHVIFFEAELADRAGEAKLPVHSVDDVMELGREAAQGGSGEKQEKVDGEDTCVIIFTSGTTGEMKGVELTQNNLVQNAIAAEAYVTSPDGEVNLAVLPLSHAFERVAGFIVPLIKGNTVAFGRGLDFLMEDMQILKPGRMDAVPRLLEKLYEGIQNNLHQKSPLLQKIFNLGIKLGEIHKRLREKNILFSILLGLPVLLFDRVFFKKVRQLFGGRLTRFLVGGALLDPRIAWFFQTIGFEILEGYGLTECSPVVSVNQSGKGKIGSVGKVLTGLEVKIDANEEICVRGHCVMKGYFKNPKETAKVMDEEGWFHTGDQGHLDEEGFLYIKGRVKELIVTSNGKNIVPNQVEQAVEASPYITQSMLFGHGRPYLVALIVPSQERVMDFAKEAHVGNGEAWDHLCHEEGVKHLIEDEVKKFSKDLARHEQIKKIAIIPEEFSQENDLLTPTLKLKRRKITERYQKILQSLYP